MHSLWTPTPDGFELLQSHSGPFIPGKRAPGNHWAGRWVGPRFGSDAFEYRTVSYPCHKLNQAYSTSVGRDSSVGIIDSLRVGRSGDRIPVGTKIFLTRPDQPGPYTIGNGSPTRIRRPERGVNNPPPPFAEIKERVELNLYSPLVPSWNVIERALPSPPSIIQPVVLSLHWVICCG